MAGNTPLAIIWAIAGVIFGLWLIFGSSRKYLTLQRIKNTPTSKVRSAAIGLVELYGNAIPKDGMVSPISGIQCAYWKIKSEYYQSGKHGGWRDFYKLSSDKQFYLDDGTGKILVDPSGAKADIPVDWCYQGYISGRGVFGFEHKKIDQRAIDFIDSLDPKTKKLFMAHDTLDVRIYESYIAEKDKVYVLGSAEPLHESKSDIAHEHLVIKKGGENILLIRDTDEKKVISDVRFSVYLSIFAGFALSAVCLLIIIMLVNV